LIEKINKVTDLKLNMILMSSKIANDKSLKIRILSLKEMNISNFGSENELLQALGLRNQKKYQDVLAWSFLH